MELIKDGIIYQQPIYTIIDGERIELTDEQLYSMGYEDYNGVLSMQDSLLHGVDKMTIDKISLIADSIAVNAPEGAVIEGDVVCGLPKTLGYKWVPYYNGKTIEFSLAEDAAAIGTLANPIIFPRVDDGYDVDLIVNGYYIYGGALYVYSGKGGKSGDFSSVSDDMVPVQQ